MDHPQSKVTGATVGDVDLIKEESKNESSEDLEQSLSKMRKKRSPSGKKKTSPTKRSKRSNYQVADFPDFGYLTPEDQAKYQAVWDSFCQAESVSGEMVPEEWQFLAYFESAFEVEEEAGGNGLKGAMNQAYTVLDALTMVFYGFGLGKWPRIKEYIQWTIKDDTIKQEVTEGNSKAVKIALRPKRAVRKGATSK